eukprot:1642191-Rhodomonas_salina.2
MSCTNIAYAAPLSPYAMCATDSAYAPPLSPYAPMPGTVRSVFTYARATRCAVLRWHMVLPDGHGPLQTRRFGLIPGTLSAYGFACHVRYWHSLMVFPVLVLHIIWCLLSYLPTHLLYNVWYWRALCDVWCWYSIRFCPMCSRACYAMSSTGIAGTDHMRCDVRVSAAAGTDHVPPDGALRCLHKVSSTLNPKTETRTPKS